MTMSSWHSVEDHVASRIAGTASRAAVQLTPSRKRRLDGGIRSAEFPDAAGEWKDGIIEPVEFDYRHGSNGVALDHQFASDRSDGRDLV